MTERPAEHRARLMRRFPLWSIRPVDSGTGWTARRAEYPNVWAATLADLEVQLSEAEGRRGAAATLARSEP